jgi:hypothetical protein
MALLKSIVAAMTKGGKVEGTNLDFNRTVEVEA